MARKIFEMEWDSEDVFERFVRAIKSGASAPMTDEELLKRWLAKGLAFDMMKPSEEGALIINRLVRVLRK